MKTKTEDVLPSLVEAVRGDMDGVAEILVGQAELLERLETQLRMDREAAMLVHGTANALRTYAGNLRDEAAGFGRRVLPAPSETDARLTLTVERITS